MEAIANGDARLWDVDVDCYTDENIELLLDTRKTICNVLGRKDKNTDTLVTKVMLGVYGNVPAFDTFFRRGLEVSTFGRKSLKKVSAFYKCHSDVIDDYARRIRTFDVSTGELTQRHYTKAKIVDMVLVIEGQ